MCEVVMLMVWGGDRVSLQSRCPGNTKECIKHDWGRTMDQLQMERGTVKNIKISG